MKFIGLFVLLLLIGSCSALQQADSLVIMPANKLEYSYELWAEGNKMSLFYFVLYDKDNNAVTNDNCTLSWTEIKDTNYLVSFADALNLINPPVLTKKLIASKTNHYYYQPVYSEWTNAYIRNVILHCSKQANLTVSVNVKTYGLLENSVGLTIFEAYKDFLPIPLVRAIANFYYWTTRLLVDPLWIIGGFIGFFVLLPASTFVFILFFVELLFIFWSFQGKKNKLKGISKLLELNAKLIHFVFSLFAQILVFVIDVVSKVISAIKPFG